MHIIYAYVCIYIFVFLGLVLMKLVNVHMEDIMFSLMMILSLFTSLIARPIDEFDVFDYGASGLGDIDDSRVKKLW